MSKANLPGLTPPTTGSVALDRWIQSVTETIQVREGARGDRQEQVLTRRDLADLGLDTTKWGRPVSGDSAKGVLVQQANGSYALVSTENFSDALRSTKLYRDLSLRIDDASRFDSAPERVKSILLQSLADEAAARGADIRNVEYKLQTTAESLAYAMQEVTASVNGAAAGVRDMSYANATANRATAGKVTQVTARLDNFGGGAATVESTMTAVANRATGLEAQYTLKARAGGVFAGIGLAASSPTAGAGTSAIILQANKFALVGPSETIADPANPPVDRLPFGYDSGTNTIYINGTVRINAGGTALQDSVGVPGPAGSPGARGSVTRYGTGAWADATAAGLLPSAPVIGDTVTLVNGASAVTKYWSGSAWVSPGVVVDGNLLVGGVISSSTLNTSGFVKASGWSTTGEHNAVGAFTTELTNQSYVGVYGQANDIGVAGISTGSYGAGVSGQSSGSGASGVFGQATSGACVAGVWGYGYGGTGVAVRAEGTVAIYPPAGVAPIYLSSTSMCTNLNANYLGGYTASNFARSTPTCVVDGILAGGSAATFSVSNKPGAASSNTWLVITIGGVQYALPAWTL